MSEKEQKETKYKSFECDNIVYSINEEEMTASAISFKSGITNIFIPRSIIQESKEYIVTSISQHAFSRPAIQSIQFAADSKLQIINNNAFSGSSIKTITIPSTVTFIGNRAFESCKKLQQIEIPEDSKLKTIDDSAFYHSSIESISIPSELTELKDGWCNSTTNLTKIFVSPKNPRYICYKDKMIIGKTNIEQSNYDCFVFCARDVENVIIPSSIERICPSALSKCNQLERVEFEKDSKLKTIDNSSFEMTSIESISIPSSVTIIGEGAFFNCELLEKVEIQNDSKLQLIKDNAFSSTLIESITIPSSVTYIGKNAFCFCNEFKHIIIPDDSKLQTIDTEAFLCSSIEDISIPSELTELKDWWCNSITNLIKIFVSPKNPRYFCVDDKMIIGKSNIEQSNYDCFVFCVRDIENIIIPSSVERICPFALSECYQLHNVEFPNDSKLQIIDEYAFCR